MQKKWKVGLIRLFQKRVINEWKKENKLKIKTEEEKINRIIYSDCYLLWLEQFTLKILVSVVIFCCTLKKE